MRLALYQTEIPQNAGTLMRLAACMGLGVDIIEPCGFVLNERRMKRAGMDYLDKVDLVKHGDWNDFLLRYNDARVVLLTPHSDLSYTDFSFESSDILLVGRESDGVPESVMNQCEAKVVIPMVPDCRSVNVAVAASMVVGEALRQTQTFPGR